jgi:2-oxoglutarate ferredoxin oxidoreductase subunit beta
VHLFRKNIDVNILLFNNRIYGLTKGQYSPTSEMGQKSKSTPYGVKERNLNALELALASQATFVARTLDREASHMQYVFSEAKAHMGSSLVEILQNCPIFNDAIFENYTNKQLQSEHVLFLEPGKPLLFGKDMEKAIVLENFTPKIVDTAQITEANLWIHEPENRQKAILLSQFGYHEYASFPLTLGVIHKNNIVENDKEEASKTKYYVASQVINKNIFKII